MTIGSVNNSPTPQIQTQKTAEKTVTKADIKSLLNELKCVKNTYKTVVFKTRYRAVGNEYTETSLKDAQRRQGFSPVSYQEMGNAFNKLFDRANVLRIKMAGTTYRHASFKEKAFDKIKHEINNMRHGVMKQATGREPLYDLTHEFIVDNRSNRSAMQQLRDHVIDETREAIRRTLQTASDIQTSPLPQIPDLPNNSDLPPPYDLPPSYKEAVSAW